ncbi:hypothetical protein [Lewinella sp. IMCC34183]|uniref:hypothetical protein n=1 Tax=Lewinella sp. IMCC34183 TaxID=2248762 RepID=UPI000E2214C8|nr:hypothetical protein [Lewinella sp. IMCC34183]
MMRSIAFPSLAGLALFCAACGTDTVASATQETAAPERPVDSTLLIVPGHRLGPLTVLQRMDSVANTIGTPTFSDSGAGTTVSTYRLADGADSAELVLILTFEPTDNMRKDLQVARTTARKFHDSYGIGVGSQREELESRYNLEGPLSTFAVAGDSVRLYDTGTGLSFEFDARGTCRGLAVHAQSRYPTSNYRPDYPEMATNNLPAVRGQ